MATTNLALQVKELFRETGHAHHEAFSDIDGADPEWPAWYAERVHRRLCTLLQADLTRSELVYLLVLVDKERALEAPGAEWTGYYARFFLERYGART